MTIRSPGIPSLPPLLEEEALQTMGLLVYLFGARRARTNTYTTDTVQLPHKLKEQVSIHRIQVHGMAPGSQKYSVMSWTVPKLQLMQVYPPWVAPWEGHALPQIRRR